MNHQDQLVEIILSRIHKGEYALRGPPSERMLAEEVCVSRKVARRALAVLIERGVLERGSNGRIQIVKGAVAQKKQIALMFPSVRGVDVSAWLSYMRQLASTRNVHIRALHYYSWHDLALSDALRGMDGVMLLPRSDDPPEWLLHRLNQHQTPTIILGADWSHWGVPSLDLFEPVLVWKLLDHLRDLGHTCIDYFHVSAVVNHTDRFRIERWRSWCELNRIKGELICDNTFQTHVIDYARQRIAQRLRDKTQEATAILCSRLMLAQGVVRAVADSGGKVGKDISVCTIDGQSVAESLVPSITAFKRPDALPSLEKYIDWVLAGGDHTTAPDFKIEEEVQLVQRESTGNPAQSLSH